MDRHPGNRQAGRFGGKHKRGILAITALQVKTLSALRASS
uniref:Transposase n=1 Tax=mine drainage metagenome TaxID=410659 RepID=E6QA78_9ZZZZ